MACEARQEGDRVQDFSPAPTSRLSFSPSSFLPLKVATQRNVFRAFIELPDSTSQRTDSGTHLGARLKLQWLPPRPRNPLQRGWKKHQPMNSGVSRGLRSSQLPNRRVHGTHPWPGSAPGQPAASRNHGPSCLLPGRRAFPQPPPPPPRQDGLLLWVSFLVGSLEF